MVEQRGITRKSAQLPQLCALAVGFGGGRTETVWTCSKCGCELGRGPVDPGQSSCPRCGVKFNGTTIGPGAIGAMPSAPGMPGMPSAPPMIPSAPPAAAGSAPALPMNPIFGVPPGPSSSSPAPSTPAPSFTVPSDSSSGSSSSSDGSSSSSSSNNRTKTIKLIGIVCGAILLLGALVALGVVVANASSSKPVRRAKRRRVMDDY